MYKQDLVLNKLQELTCNKTQLNQSFARDYYH